MKLTGKNVLITGAARGIGAQLARELARRGARLSLVGLEADKLEALATELGPQHVWFEADVCDSAAQEAAVAATVAALGGLDVAVANAGIANFGTVEKGDPEAWAKTVDVNLTGMFRTAQATLPHLIASRGYLLIISSLASFTSPPGLSAYAASKWGAEALANCTRQEVGFRGVKVGSCHPSWIDTDLVRDAEADLPSFKEMRSKLPWPANTTTSVEACVAAITAGIEKRKRKICVPGAVGVVGMIRPLVNGPLADLAMRRDVKRLMPQMEAEVERLGRDTSARTAALK